MMDLVSEVLDAVEAQVAAALVIKGEGDIKVVGRYPHFVVSGDAPAGEEVAGDYRLYQVCHMGAPAEQRVIAESATAL